MNQILNIFKKDTRRFGLEILVSLVIAAALVCVSPLQWTGPPSAVWGGNNDRLMILAMLTRGLGLLLVISWAVLIIRIIHAEGLVGDRQFWLTRPYEWPKLIAAKALFIAAFIMLPLVIAQCLLLAQAGLHPLASAGGMAFNLVLIAGMLILPLVAIAAVTSDFTRMTLAVLGVLVGVAVLAVVVTMHGWRGMEGSFIGRFLFLAYADPFLPSRDLASTGHHSQLPIALLLLAVCGMAIVLQYARRRTGISRLVLLALPVALTILVLLTAHGSGPAHPFAEPVYPPLAGGAAPPVLLTYAPDEQHAFYAAKGGNPVGIRIPIHVSGVAADSAVIAGAFPKITITGANGFVWSATTPEFYPEKFVPTSDWSHDGFFIPRDVYDRLKSGLVTIDLSFALTQLQATKVIRLPMPLGDVMVPGFGVCGRRSLGHGFMECRSALGEPPLTYASADWSATPCPASQTELKQVRGETWAGMLDADPAEFGITPTLSTGFAFMPDMNNATGGKYLCSGSMITLTQYKLAGRMQSDLVIANFKLPED